MNEIEAANRTTILVCITCRTAAAAAESGGELACAGATLADATETAVGESADIGLQRVRCLGNCNRGPSAIIRHPKAWTYVFGGLDPERDAQTLVLGARLLAQAGDGLMPWRGRPEALKRGLIARVPPVDFIEEPARG